MPTHKGRYFTLSSGQDLDDLEGQWTREENRTKSDALGNNNSPLKYHCAYQIFLVYLVLPSQLILKTYPCERDAHPTRLDTLFFGVTSQGHLHTYQSFVLYLRFGLR
jgi:hypothetical protein